MHDTPGQQQVLNIQTHYMTLDSLGLEPGKLDFYQLLLSCTGENAAGEKIRHAMHFRMDGCARASFIGRLDALPAPLLRFPLWRTELEHLPGELSRDTLLASVQGQLGQRPGTFLMSVGWKTAQADVWQSLLALALTQNQLADAALQQQLTDVLRVGYFLRTLDGGAYSLTSHAERRRVLAAQLVWPDVLMLPH